MVMYEIWSLGQKPFSDFTNTQVCFIKPHELYQHVDEIEVVAYVTTTPAIL